MNWIAYSLDPWMQIISDSTGTNSGTVTVNVDENLYCPRTGRIIVRAPGALHSPREVSIYQKAGPNTNEVDITPPNLNEDDFFGDWVDVDGEYAIVGAQGDDQYGAEAGVAYIFKRDGCCSWIQKAKLHASDAVDFDNFGRSVSISGDVAIVSNVNFDHPTIYLFQKPTGGWQDMTESAKLSPPGGQANYTFGKVADISGEYVIASVPGAYPPYIMFYERPTGGWLDMTPTVVIEKDIFGGFGESLVLDGVYAVIGSPMENQNTGCVYVYKRDWNWGEQVRLAPSDGTANDNFGKSVDLSDDLIIVGAHIERAAYIYRNNGSQWIEEQKIPSPTGTLGFAIGTKSVAIEKNIALVGDHYGGRWRMCFFLHIWYNRLVIF